MLKNSFMHIQGIGEKTERRLWASGILSWDDFDNEKNSHLLDSRREYIRHGLHESRLHIEDDPLFFVKRLPAGERWRLLPHYREAMAYLDIETSGGIPKDDSITTIVVYDGRKVFHYIRDENLHLFIEDIMEYQVLVTYSGAGFDLPHIERYFGRNLPHAHIDLRPVLRKLGYVGGLKACERQMGLSRDCLEGVDGYYAVLLWRLYRQYGEVRVIETLLAYNAYDVLHLERLLFEAYNKNLVNTPFALSHRIPLPHPPENPFHADPILIDELKRIVQS